MTDVRQQLAAIPDLYAQLALYRRAGSRPVDPNSTRGGKPGSRPPVDLTVLDLEDTRAKVDTDPTRRPEEREADRLAESRRLGVLPHLCQWVRLVDGEMWDEDVEHDPPAETPTVASECGWLVDQLFWIRQQQWMDEFTAEVGKLAADLRRAVGERPAAKLACPTCGNAAFIDGEWLACSEVREHDRTVVTLEAEFRRRPPMKASDARVEFGLSEAILPQWKARGKIRPARVEGRTPFYWPWDIFRLMNPAIAEALDARDEVVAQV